MSEADRKLEELIRRVAKDLFYELLDEHLDDYEHKEKKHEEKSTNDLTERWGEEEDHGVRI